MNRLRRFNDGGQIMIDPETGLPINPPSTAGNGTQYYVPYTQGDFNGSVYDHGLEAIPEYYAPSPNYPYERVDPGQVMPTEGVVPMEGEFSNYDGLINVPFAQEIEGSGEMMPPTDEINFDEDIEGDYVDGKSQTFEDRKQAKKKELENRIETIRKTPARYRDRNLLRETKRQLKDLDNKVKDKVIYHDPEGDNLQYIDGYGTVNVDSENDENRFGDLEFIRSLTERERKQKEKDKELMEKYNITPETHAVNEYNSMTIYKVDPSQFKNGKVPLEVKNMLSRLNDRAYYNYRKAEDTHADTMDEQVTFGGFKDVMNGDYGKGIAKITAGIGLTVLEALGGAGGAMKKGMVITDKGSDFNKALKAYTEGLNPNELSKGAKKYYDKMVNLKNTSPDFEKKLIERKRLLEQAKEAINKAKNEVRNRIKEAKRTGNKKALQNATKDLKRLESGHIPTLSEEIRRVDKMIGGAQSIQQNIQPHPNLFAKMLSENSNLRHVLVNDATTLLPKSSFSGAIPRGFIDNGVMKVAGREFRIPGFMTRPQQLNQRAIPGSKAQMYINNIDASRGLNYGTFLLPKIGRTTNTMINSNSEYE